VKVDNGDDVSEIKAYANSDEESEVSHETENINTARDDKIECSDVESGSDDAALVNAKEINVSDDKTVYSGECYDNESESDDDAPEDITLKESKKAVQKVLKEQVKSAQLSKERKKKLVKEREKQNKLQHSKKSVTIKSSIPEKLDAELLELAAEEEAKKPRDNKKLHTPVVTANHKTYFSDSDHDSEDEDTIEENKIQACYIGKVKKDMDKSVQDFLQNHFYGNRLQREVFKGNKKKRKRGNGCDVSWLKKRNVTSSV